MKDKQDFKCYKKLVSDNLLPLWTQGYKLFQDNAPIHVSESTKKCLNANGIDKLQWSSRSPDLNPMQNLWGVLTRIVYRKGRQFNSINALRKAIIHVWTEISLEVLQNFLFR